MNRIFTFFTLAIFWCCPFLLVAENQSSDAPLPASAQPSQPAASPSDKNSGSEANLIPTFDPNGEIVTWNGQIWNIHNNRIIRSRLEKYLNEPPMTSAEDIAYMSVIGQILNKLSPNNADKTNVDDAWQLLFKASKYPGDANLSASIAEAVYAVWLNRAEQERVDKANAKLRKEQESLTSNMEMEASTNSLSNIPPKDSTQARIWAEQQQQQRQIRLSPYIKRMEELDNKYKINLLKNEGAQLESKIQFQALIVQLFSLRRFQHVLIASRFYRNIYGDGDNKLNLSDDAKGLFAKGSGIPPTLSVVDTLANESISDVKKGVDAYLFLMQKGETDSAIKRLTEAYSIGEHLPVIQTLSRDDKRIGLSYLQKSNALLSALEVKDYAEAQKLVDELKAMSKDFVPTKPLAAIRTANALSNMHLAKAQTAAAAGNQDIFESELKAAAEIWPGNPKLAELSTAIFNQVNKQQQAIMDLERLLTQKNYREIFDNKIKYIAATAMLPEKQKTLAEILEKMQKVEIAMAQAAEINKRGDAAGAWETIEMVYQESPNDNKLNQIRAEYTVRASDFVKSIQTAGELEKKSEYGSSLAWYLKARQIYPPSYYAQQGIDKIVKTIFAEPKIQELTDEKTILNPEKETH